MNTVIQIVGMTKTYVLGDIEVHALRGVNLTIERGEFVAVVMVVLARIGNECKSRPLGQRSPRDDRLLWY